MRQLQPAAQVRLLREGVQDRAIGGQDVLRIARERHPTEGALPLAEERPDVSRHEPRIGERVAHTALLRERAQVVSIIEDVAAPPAQLEHRFHVPGHALQAALLVAHRVSRAELRGGFHRQAGRDVSIQWIVRRGLVGDQVRLDSTPHQLR